MLSGIKNLKDSTTTNTNISVKDISISYTKTHKLITALYMVTDIIDKEEPIRNKLRNLGTAIISDIHSIPANAGGKINETVSFLNIASAMNFISEMNCAILQKEFFELKASIQDHTEIQPKWITDFFETPSRTPLFSGHVPASMDGVNSKGHTRIGVQKGSTLMKALSDKIGVMSDRKNSVSLVSPFRDRSGFDLLKKERRFNIIKILKENGGSASIKDVKDKINIGVTDALACSEKTLQRELMSMTKDGVLNKTGEKRWSRYFIKN